jgi:hypothetical protein
MRIITTHAKRHDACMPDPRQDATSASPPRSISSNWIMCAGMQCSACVYLQHPECACLHEDTCPIWYAKGLAVVWPAETQLALRPIGA